MPRIPDAVSKLSIAAIKPTAVGLLTHVPGFCRLITRTGGTDNPRYCYSVWLRHLVTVNDHHLLVGVPPRVAEIGPGDSIGIGLAALLSGVRQYSAIDIARLANSERNLSILRQLITLFKERAAIPDEREFPLVSPRLESYQFPASLVTDAMLESSLSEARIQAIADAVTTATTSDAPSRPIITYVAPWTKIDILPAASFDLIYSQAVLEHVDQLDQMYAAMHAWLKPGGVMSHDIDFSHHRIGPLWNSHWSYSRRVWRLIRGRRAWLLNRQPHSRHLEIIRRSGFELVADVSTRRTVGLKRSDLASEFADMSDDDLVTSESYVLAIKR
ncbi:MAG: methyltransferase domain-containing protein [Chloroflexota bacterium]|nr:methyltransferase domain-containing protein [Chloroflexota bacterium]